MFRCEVCGSLAEVRALALLALAAAAHAPRSGGSSSRRALTSSARERARRSSRASSASQSSPVARPQNVPPVSDARDVAGARELAREEPSLDRPRCLVHGHDARIDLDPDHVALAERRRFVLDAASQRRCRPREQQPCLRRASTNSSRHFCLVALKVAAEVPGEQAQLAQVDPGRRAVSATAPSGRPWRRHRARRLWRGLRFAARAAAALRCASPCSRACLRRPQVACRRWQARSRPAPRAGAARGRPP